MSYNPEFDQEVKNNIAQLSDNQAFDDTNRQWMDQSLALKYSYNFNWLGRPIIQYPQDMVQVQELIWQIKPDLIIEAGIAHGGSLILSASMLALIEMAEATEQQTVLDPTAPKRKVIGIDIDIREHNRQAVEEHPFSNRIEMLQGSSIDENIVEQVKKRAEPYNKIMVFLDSNHTFEHVLKELELYAPLVSVGSYCVVFDTIINDMPEKLSEHRPWGKNNNPLQSVQHFLKQNNQFTVNEEIDHKLKITAARNGYLQRVK